MAGSMKFDYEKARPPRNKKPAHLASALKMRRPASSLPGSCVIRLLVGVVAGADQRAGLYVAEAEAQSLFF
jgi:hypothetical protein